MSGRLLGAWKLESLIREEIPSGAKADFFGPNPIGFINYGLDRRVIVIIVRRDRKRPAGQTATAAEAEALMTSLVSYTGTYTIDGDEITHHVDASWNETWTGGRQTRPFKIEGDRLHLSTRPSPDPVDGRWSILSLIWERLK